MGNKRTYTREEVHNATLKYFNGDELATSVWMSKYALNKADLFYELTPDDMHHRMAEKFYEKMLHTGVSDLMSKEEIYNRFKDFKYIIPQGSVMSQLGNYLQFGSLSNCTVVDSPEDSYGGILHTDEQLAQLMKRRCGVGVDISTLRPSKSHVSNSAGTSAGAVSFMDRFSNTTREVAQDGRRGALMLTIDINHPDVAEFVIIKENLTRVTGANISVQITDEFMKAVENDKDFIHRWPIDSELQDLDYDMIEYDVTLPDNFGGYHRKVKARKLWDSIVSQARNNAEPGIIFKDRQHWYSPSSIYDEYKNIVSNPCGEIVMGKNDSCRLIALNMFSCVDNPYTKKAKFNYKKWESVVSDGMLLNDVLVDLELDSIKVIINKIKKDPEASAIKKNEMNMWIDFYNKGRDGRRAGLGFTGLGDTFAALGEQYGSPKSLRTLKKIMKTKLWSELSMSIDLAERFKPFKGFDITHETSYSDFTKMIKKEFPELYDRMAVHGRRNVSWATVAPGGSISLLAQITSGIEPVFASSYIRRKKINADDKDLVPDFIDANGDKWVEFKVYHKGIYDYMNANNILGEITDEIVATSGYANSTAPEINWENRIKIQAVIQDYTSHSLSSTLNLDKDTTEQEVNDIYFYAWKHKLKGVTVYRDGSRDGVMITDAKEKETEEIVKRIHHIPKRPKRIKTHVLTFTNGGSKWIGLIGELDDIPYEMFTGDAQAFTIPSYITDGEIVKIKNGYSDGSTRYDFEYIDNDGIVCVVEGLNKAFNPVYYDYARMLSAFMRHGMPPHSIITLLDGLTLDGELLGTWKAGVKRMIKKFIKQEELNRGEGIGMGDVCESCGDPNGIIYEEGCLKCRSCGYSKC